jgi:hypothetical protein
MSTTVKRMQRDIKVMQRKLDTVAKRLSIRKKKTKRGPAKKK